MFRISPLIFERILSRKLEGEYPGNGPLCQVNQLPGDNHLFGQAGYGSQDKLHK